MRDVIIGGYKGSPYAKYKGEWKNTYEELAKKLDLHLETDYRDEWPSIEEQLVLANKNRPVDMSLSPVLGKRSSDTFCCSDDDDNDDSVDTRALYPQILLDDADRSRIRRKYNDLDKKWLLKSGSYDEDVMLETTTEMKYQQ
jgi:hypothetical protein